MTGFIAKYEFLILLSTMLLVAYVAIFFLGLILGRRLADRDLPPSSYGPFGDDHEDLPNIDQSWGGR